MGYIAPVPNYQYSQYAEREVNQKYDPFRFVPIDPTKALSNGNHSIMLKREESRTKTNHKNKAGIKKVKTQKVIDKIYSEVTGKGALFNESV
ncbi:hypothetical protein [Bacillus dakarensis]|uniref:hypothetical protein n=1 Tax=Robertmurraya dakarensis TaxID=1926278 RepID=UPI000981DF31|nr:hypothetical protein [Bacillus dakarensis]